MCYLREMPGVVVIVYYIRLLESYSVYKIDY